MRTFIIAALVLAASLSAIPLASAQTPAVAPERTASPPGAEAYIISPKDGATVRSPAVLAAHRGSDAGRGRRALRCGAERRRRAHATCALDLAADSDAGALRAPSSCGSKSST